MLIEAVTVAAPGVIPAVAVTSATPFELVVVEVAESVTGPLTENTTGTPANGSPLLPVTITASRLVNATPSTAVWLLPLSMVRPLTVTGCTAVMANRATALKLVFEVTVTLMAPDAKALSTGF